MRKTVKVMIKVEKISKTFGKTQALKEVSLEIGDKECFALLGFNGAGKTTLLNILSTVLTPTGGTAWIDGYRLGEENEKIKSILNIAPQEIAVAKNLTVEENLCLIADLYEIKDKKQRVEEMLSSFGLTEKRKAQAKKLSGGQLKRLSIALAVLTQPKILFLDEPTLGLDIKARQRLWEMIKGLKEKMTILLTTHYLEEVEELTDRIAIISRGEIKGVGTLKELLSLTGQTTLEGAFLALSEEEE